MLELDQATGELRGVLKDLRFVNATGESKIGTVAVTGSLANEEISIYTTTLWNFDVRGVILESGDIAGTFECCAIGDVRGTVTATRILQ